LIGERDRAQALCQKLSFAGPLLLYAEEVDANADTNQNEQIVNVPSSLSYPVSAFSTRHRSTR
jgi:hypothetical protein